MVLKKQLCKSFNSIGFEKQKSCPFQLGFATNDQVLPETIQLNKCDPTFSKAFYSQMLLFVGLVFCVTT